MPNRRAAILRGAAAGTLLALIAGACSTSVDTSALAPTEGPVAPAEPAEPTPTTTPGPSPTHPPPPTTSPVAEPTPTARPTAGPTVVPDTGARAGSDSAGDAYYPGLGNSGYDVATYDVALEIDPDAEHVDGVVTAVATADADLASFNFDLVGLQVNEITVDGAPAQFTRMDGELTITPVEPLREGQEFTTVVSYEGRPEPIRGVTNIGAEGWFWSGDVSYVAGEPVGTAGWMPVNDHPIDKALFRFELTIPSDLEVVANGLLTEKIDEGDQTTWIYRSEFPQAPYLSTIVVGDLELIEGGEVEVEPGRTVVVRNAIHRPLVDEAGDFDRTPEMIEVFSELFGPYPFEAYGVVVVDSSFGAALETQTLSIFGSDFVRSPGSIDYVVAHELAHQWFGNSVSVSQWQDIWLNEGWATYAESLWLEATDPGFDIDAEMRTIASLQPGLLREPLVGDPGPDALFSASVYFGGALVLHALRRTIGDVAFFAGTRTYLERFRDGNATTADLQAVMEEASGQDLATFFNEWLYVPTLPDLPF